MLITAFNIDNVNPFTPGDNAVVLFDTVKFFFITTNINTKNNKDDSESSDPNCIWRLKLIPYIKIRKGHLTLDVP